MNEIKTIYKKLFDMYGPQGWWPLLEYSGTNPTKTGSLTGYHPGNYELPETQNQIFEICLGAILTQSISWVGAEKALFNLKKLNALTPDKLTKLDKRELAQTIKPAGYFNQKAKKLRQFTKFFLQLEVKPTRKQLLSIWGVGEETADSMLLYAFKVPTFVVDAYTRRIFANLGFIDRDASYSKVKKLFEDNLEPDLIVSQEYHALIVEHAKRYYKGRKKKYDCPLKQLFVKD
ncbi:endonuclease III domain-containing protein [Candidatus Woesearchaeota archaeon]|nr:endonuclease III domain-containing protein [Candidatus Woesearchaeota archaeon]